VLNIIYRRFSGQPLAAASTALLILAGAGIVVGGISHPITYRLSLGFAVFALAGILIGRTRVSERALERVRQEGYDQGYIDGREIARPVLVSLSGETVAG
jgi:hypothetical protein